MDTAASSTPSNDGDATSRDGSATPAGAADQATPIETDQAGLLGPVIRRGRLTLFIGAPHAGKTTLLFQYFAVALKASSEGAEFFGLRVPPGLCVAYVSIDKTKSDVESTARTVGLDLRQLARVWTLHDSRQCEDSNSLSVKSIVNQPWETLLHLLNALVAEHPQVDLIVVEGLGAWMGGDLNGYNTATRRLLHVIAWLEAHPRVAVVGVHHSSKARSDFHFLRAMDATNGSTGLNAFTSSSMTLQTPQELEAGFYRWTLNPRSAPEQRIWLDRPQTSKVFLPGNTPHIETKAQKAERLIVAIVKNHHPIGIRREPLVEQLEKGHDISKTTTTSALARLINDPQTKKHDATRPSLLVHDDERGYTLTDAGLVADDSACRPL